MNGLTKINAQWCLYSGISFLTMLSIISPTTRLGCVLIILGVLSYIGFDSLKKFGESFVETRNKNKAIISALSANGIDIALFVLFFCLGLFLGLH